MNARPRIMAAALAAVLPILSARGGPPYATDDPEPVAFGHWEAYLASQATFGRDGFSGTAPILEVNYGAAPNLQLHALAPLAVLAGGGASARWGPGDVELGAKVRFLHLESSDVQVAAFPILTLPTGSADRGLGEGSATVLIPVWLQARRGPWTTYGGAGYRVCTAAESEDSWFLGWQAQRSLGRVAVGAEVFRETSSSATLSGTTGATVGAVVDLSDTHHLLVSFGAAGAPTEFHAYAGWLVTLAPSSP